MATHRRQAGSPPLIEADFSRGIIRDAPRVAIPQGALYDSTDFLLHQPGVAIKRGGTSYAGPVLSGAQTFTGGVAYAPFPGGSQIVGIGGTGGGNNNHLYKVTAGATTDKGQIINEAPTVDTPKFRAGGASPVLVIASSDGTNGPYTYDGTAAPAALGGTPPAGKFLAIYKTRVALANSTAQPQRIYFSPTPTISSTWDTANSYLDATYAVTGLAALNNVLLVFSDGHLERVIGSTPPPNTDMDLGPVAGIGCTDARSIAVADGYCYFANPRGVYVTNGATPVSMTKQGGIETYWQSLFSSYDPATWTISAGMLRSYLIVCVLNGTTLVATLMCNAQGGNRAWWRITNVKATMFASATGVNDELYYSDAASNRVIALSGMFSPTSSNKNDADGTAVAPTMEFRALGDGTGVKAFGHAHLTYDMRDSASDNPTMAVTVKTGIKASTSSTPAESPLAETTDATRSRFAVNKDSQAVTVSLAQTNASSLTEVYALEVDQRLYPAEADGQ